MSLENLENESSTLPEFLAASGLLPGDVPDWKHLNPFEVKIALSAKTRIVSDGVLIPYADMDGSPMITNGVPHIRVRLLNEAWLKKTKEGKYRSRSGSGSRIYIPKTFKSLMSSGRPMVITEGEKKAEALCKSGVPCVAVAGVHMGRVRTNPEDKTSPRRLNADLIEVVQEYLSVCGDFARVLVLFDSDGLPHITKTEEIKKPVRFKASQKFVANTDVYFEAVGLAQVLREKFSGVRFEAAWCPVGHAGEKQGVDDWLIADGKQPVTAVINDLAGETDITAQDRESANEKKRVADLRSGYAPLGKDGKDMVIWSVPLERVVAVSSTGLSRSPEIMILVGPEYAESHWPKVSKDGSVSLDVYAAQKTIIKTCLEKGFWSQNRERGGGVWSDQGKLIINAASGLFVTGRQGLMQMRSSDRYTGEYIYPAVSSYVVNPVDLQDVVPIALSERMVDHFSKWSWSGTKDQLLLCGWILAQAYLGALDTRPSITLCGESGAGKSVLQQHVSAILGGTAWRIDDGANSTAAGIRQKIGKDAVTVLIDESEPGSIDHQVAMMRGASLRKLLDMLRASYSLSDGARGLATIKGSTDGRAVEFSIRTSAMLAAIGRPDFEQADRNRFLILEVKKAGRRAVCPTSDGIDQMGEELRHLMWARWNVFNEFYAAILEQGPSTIIGIDARLLKTWGTPIAAWMTLQTDTVTPEHITQMLDYLTEVAAEQGVAGNTDANETDSEKALMCLLGARMALEKTIMNANGLEHTTRLDRTVYEVFEMAKKKHIKDNDDFSGKALKRLGMARVDAEHGVPLLFVTDCAELRSLLKNTAFSGSQSIVNLLSRLPGATKTRQRVGAGRASGVTLPMIAYADQNQAESEHTN